MKEQRSVIIRRPVEQVFAYVSDLRHSAEWQSGLLNVRKATEGPLAVGTRFVFVRKLLGRKLEGSNEFVAYEPHRIVTFTFSAGPMPGEGSYLFDSVPEGTKLTSTVELRPAGFSRLMAPWITTSLGGQMEANLRRLKNLLENPVPRTSA